MLLRRSNVLEEQCRSQANTYNSPVKVTGYIDLDIYNIVVLPTICGIKLGDEFSENLVDGMTIKFQIVAANGALKYYLKNGDEVWTNIDIQTTFAGTYEGDYKIITL